MPSCATPATGLRIPSDARAYSMKLVGAGQIPLFSLWRWKTVTSSLSTVLAGNRPCVRTSARAALVRRRKFQSARTAAHSWQPRTRHKLSRNPLACPYHARDVSLLQRQQGGRPDPGGRTSAFVELQTPQPPRVPVLAGTQRRASGAQQCLRSHMIASEATKVRCVPAAGV